MATENVRVETLRIAGGVRRQGTPEQLGNMAVWHGGRSKGSLFVLVEAEGAGAADIERMLVDTVISSYRRSAGSLTSGLTGSIKDANLRLYNENKATMRDLRTVAGVFCAVLRDNDLFLASAGPAVALIIDEQSVHRLPAEMPWLEADSKAPAAAPAYLGVRAEIEPYLFRSQFETGHTLVLATTSLLHFANEEELSNAVSEEGVDALAELARGEDVTALAVTAVEAEEEAAEAPAPPPANSMVAGLSRVSGALAGLLAAKPKPGAALRPARPGAAPAPQAEVSRRSVPAPAHSEPVHVEPVKRDAPPEPAAVPAEGGLPAWLDSEQPTAVGRRGPATRARPALPRLGGSGRTRLAVSLLAVAGIIALAAFAFVRQGQQREADYQDILHQAETKRTLGLASFNTTEALSHLKEAESLAVKAQMERPTDTNAQALIAQIRSDLDEIKHVTRLSNEQVTVLATFAQTGTAPGRVVGDGTNLFVLDKGERVYRFVLDASGKNVQAASGDNVLVRKGDQVGGVVVGDIMDIAWVPAGGARTTDNLMALESGGNLIQYDPAKGLSALPVANARNWRKVQATGGYGGNFYVMDSQANAILRYVPQAGGYNTPPSNYLATTVDLVNAVDMAIDGDIFVLFSNGAITYLTKGRPQPFTFDGLDEPMQTPVSIFTNTGSEHVYVADPANARILRFDKAGKLLRQIVYEDAEGTFQRLRGVFVDEKKESIYAVAGTKLVRLPLPAK